MKKGNKGVLLAILVIAIVLGLLGYTRFFSIFGGKGTSEKTTREIAMGCTLDAYTQFHIHPYLKIVINGNEYPIPANTGISLSCMHPLHAHDETGKIHIESPEKRDFTLGDFFAVWGKAFNRSQILDYEADAGHEIVSTVDGVVNMEYENLVLTDGQQIVIEYKAI